MCHSRCCFVNRIVSHVPCSHYVHCRSVFVRLANYNLHHLFQLTHTAFHLKTGGVCLFNCPIVLYKQKKLMALKALRDIVNGLRHQIELLDKAIEDTQKEIDDLKIISTRSVII